METINKLTILIVTYESEKTISACLKSLIQDPYAKEIIVVDNASNDSTRKLVKQFGTVKLIENKVNLGFGKANSLAAKEVKSDYLFFLNPDCAVEEGAIKKLSNYLGGHPDVGVVGPKLLDSQGRAQGEISPFPTILSEDLVLVRLHRLPFFKNIVYPKYNLDQTQEVEHLMGAAIMVRRSIFEKIGGFDPEFFLWFEETDLLKRIKEAGFRIIYYPEASVTHTVGQSTRQLNFFKKQTIWNKSLIYYFRKHKAWVKLLLLVPFIILSYPAALVSYLVKK